MARTEHPTVTDARNRRAPGRAKLADILAELDRDRANARQISRCLVADAHNKMAARREARVNRMVLRMGELS